MRTMALVLSRSVGPAGAEGPDITHSPRNLCSTTTAARIPLVVAAARGFMFGVRASAGLTSDSNVTCSCRLPKSSPTGAAAWPASSMNQRAAAVCRAENHQRSEASRPAEEATACTADVAEGQWVLMREGQAVKAVLLLAALHDVMLCCC